MAEGAYDACPKQIAGAFVVTKNEPLDAHVCQRATAQCYRSSHPIPDTRSLEAGRALLEFIASTPKTARLVFLISGGSSSLLEVLAPDVSLEELIEINTWLLANGFTIHDINAIRARLSLIKGGGLLNYIQQRPCEVRFVSDVPGDVMASIGSGWLFSSPELKMDISCLPTRLQHILLSTPRQFSYRKPYKQVISAEIIAKNHDALRAIQHAACELNLEVFWDEEQLLTEDVHTTAMRIIKKLKTGPAGIYLWGGEPTVTLPAQPGRGGRNQHLALLIAKQISKSNDTVFLSVGSDGNDGVTDDAGAIVDGQTITRGIDAGLDVDDCLAQADSGRFLAVTDDLVYTGPTGSNVMDIIMAIKN